MKKRKVMAILLTAACISSLCGGLTVRADGKQKLTITYRPVTTQQGDTYEEYINKTYENWDKKDDRIYRQRLSYKDPASDAG